MIIAAVIGSPSMILKKDVIAISRKISRSRLKIIELITEPTPAPMVIAGAINQPAAPDAKVKMVLKILPATSL
jgi:hypothetical protein